MNTPPRAAGTPVVYRCAECKKLVVVSAGKVLRSCGHEEAGISAELTATVYSQSSLGA